MVRDLWVNGSMYCWYYNEDDKKAYKNKGAAYHKYIGEEREVVEINGSYYIAFGRKYKKATLGEETYFQG